MYTRFAQIATVAFALSAVSACQVSSPATTEPPPNTVVADATGVTIYTPEFQIPPGDSFTCFYMNYKTAEELDIVNADGGQQQGGHHIIAYFATDERPVGAHTCTDQEMTNLNQIAGAAGKEGGQVLQLPPGLALKVPAGKQLVVQAHYINATGKTQTVRDWVKIVKGDPSKVKNFVNFLVTNDDGFMVPPNSPVSRTTECTLDNDYQMALLLPHMHELGQHFTLEVLDSAHNHVDTPIDTDWQPSYMSHPPLQTFDMSTPYMLKKGQILRQTCTWDNSTADPVLFPREMCLTFFYYWPGNGDQFCTMKVPGTP